jgi:hypothetical protein
MGVLRQGKHPALLVLLCVLGNALAVNYVFDENLFSKDTWHLWKLDSPLDGMNPSSELELAVVRDVPYPDVTVTSHNSLDGPGPRKLGLQTHEWVSQQLTCWPRMPRAPRIRRDTADAAGVHHAAPLARTSRH